MDIKFRTHRLTHGKNLLIKGKDLQKLGVSSSEDTLIEFDVPGLSAVIIMKLNPLEPVPVEILKMIERREKEDSEQVDSSPFSSCAQDAHVLSQSSFPGSFEEGRMG